MNEDIEDILTFLAHRVVELEDNTIHLSNLVKRESSHVIDNPFDYVEFVEKARNDTREFYREFVTVNYPMIKEQWHSYKPHAKLISGLPYQRDIYDDLYDFEK